MSRIKLVSYVFSILLCSIGIYSTFYPTLTSGFRLLQTDPGDTLFNAYILEHTYQYFFNKNYTADLWSPAFFYPYKNVLTYSVNLFGVAPFYWFFRLFFGWLPAYQLWMILMLVFMYTSFYLLMKSINCRSYISALSSYIFAFNITRVIQLGHQQLLAQFYTPLFFIFLIKFLRQPTSKLLFYTLLFLFLQIIGDFYLAWFLILSLCIFIPILSYLDNKLKNKVINFISIKYINILVVFIIWFLLTILSLYPYIRFSVDPIAIRSVSEVEKMLPSIFTWLQSPPGSLWYQNFSFNFPEFTGEHYLFIGIFTIAIMIFSLFLFFLSNKRKDTSLILSCILTIAILFIISLKLGDGISLWFQIYTLVPGAKAIRTVTRVEYIIYFYLIFSSFVALDRIFKYIIKIKILIVILGCLFMFIMIEQNKYERSNFEVNKFINNISFVKSSIDLSSEKCDVAYVRTDSTDIYRRITVQLIAMFAGLQSGVPVINGYSGFFPYPLNKNFSESELKKLAGISSQTRICQMSL